MTMPRAGFGPFTDQSWSLLEPWAARLDEQVARLAGEQIAVRRHLHAHPEPSGRELETTQFLTQRLREADLAPRLYRNADGEEVGASVDVTIGRPRPAAPLIAVRSDIDALLMDDEKTVEYRSRNPGVTHACGHDAHAAIVLGAGLAAAGAGGQPDDGEFGARLRLLFQPAEENSLGARWLIEQGAIDGVEAILGVHVDPERTAGTVGIRYGTLTANCDEVTIVIEGHGGHAARPHHSTDPIATAAQLINALYQLLPRSVDSHSPSVFTVGTIRGGYAPNVIPERVELAATLRTIEPHTHERIKHRILDICRGVETASEARIHVGFPCTLKSVNNDHRITSALDEAAQKVLGPENALRIDRPSMGGEDFSAYLDYVPGALLRLGCATPGVKAPFLHSPQFDIDERILSLGTRILIRAALLLSTAGRAEE
ncbi:MAG: M20 metallopeptidase family protein [Planctomycetaceae bacterium]